MFDANITSNTYESEKGVIKFENNVSTVSTRAFVDCDNLETIILPNSILEVGGAAFQGLSSIISITMGNNIATIYPSAFSNCTELLSIFINTQTPPKLSYPILSGNEICNIYVPSESVDSYKSAQIWSSYADRIYQIE